MQSLQMRQSALSLPLSAALELGESVLDGSGAFIADTEEKKDSHEDSDSDGDNSYISCCRRDAGIAGERMIGCES